jgi:hypothetical protein
MYKRTVVKSLEFSWFKKGVLFLGVFAKLRKVTVSFVMSVGMEQLGCHWMHFDEILYLRVFKKCRGNSSFIEI